MYSIKHSHSALEIENSSKTIFAKICLNDGASLQELKLFGQTLIKNLGPLEYKNTYASSILFPFANRIKDGTYTYNNETYKFPVNEVPNNNALHGLVFDKTFDVIDETTTENSASVKLLYKEDKKSEGFPFTYSIQLEYRITETTLDLNVEVKNTDSETFPFTLGWHPYFLSSNLSESLLSFESTKKMVFSERMITTETTNNPDPSEMLLKDKQLDDCWELDKTEVEFATPNYNLSINSSEENCFLQAYTPPLVNVIAIEPTTGVSDSFNNKIGLKTLAPNATYQLDWSLKLN
ncbi:aldose 1-epimerase [Algibacter lectus]|uniref:Aldose 1-epimerase n=1 Tax=Algibacter lectus TaxID=221126 RepID=A0A090W0T1_9FLAO|nr:aldose 1-epimerase [Algibacter lectus]MWW25103.1 aldose 1-epimerase [Algibacter lectus]TDY64483.1 aldose 1-epimerase [Algibacter lectus]GAL61152.1 putative aldose-1-epimerase [Algibacter lectus]